MTVVMAMTQLWRFENNDSIVVICCYDRHCNIRPLKIVVTNANEGIKPHPKLERFRFIPTEIAVMCD